MFSFAKRQKEPGWLSACAREECVEFAHVVRTPGALPKLALWFAEALLKGAAEPLGECLSRVGKARELKKYRCTSQLNLGDYQFIQVEAPPVPDAEMKEALRWKLKDLLETPSDSLTYDILPIPDISSGSRPKQLFLAVAAQPIIVPLVQGFQAAGLALEAIDLPELALRNVAELFEEPNRGLAFLAFGAKSALLVFTYAGELFAFRRIEIGCEQFAQANPERREQLAERVMLEIQRSMDTVDRQFSSISLSHLIVALPPESGLEAHFSNALYLPFETMDLAKKMDLSAFPELADGEAQRRALLTIGAALRDEAPVA